MPFNEVGIVSWYKYKKEVSHDLFISLDKLFNISNLFILFFIISPVFSSIVSLALKVFKHILAIANLDGDGIACEQLNRILAADNWSL